MDLNQVLCPAYTLEHYAFGEPIQNPVLREVVPRITALVVPFFYALQTVAYFFVSLIDFTSCLLRLSRGILCQYALVHTGNSVKNLISSVLEIPEKMIFGNRHAPNYLDDQQRYLRKDFSERIDLL